MADVLERGVDDLDAAWAGDLAPRRADRHEVHARSPAEDGSEGVGLVGQHALVGDDGDLSFHVTNPRAQSRTSGVRHSTHSAHVQRVNRRRSLPGPLTSHRRASSGGRRRRRRGHDRVGSALVDDRRTGRPRWNGRPSSKHTVQPSAPGARASAGRPRGVARPSARRARLAPSDGVDQRSGQRGDQGAGDATEPGRRAVGHAIDDAPRQIPRPHRVRRVDSPTCSHAPESRALEHLGSNPSHTQIGQRGGSTPAPTPRLHDLDIVMTWSGRRSGRRARTAGRRSRRHRWCPQPPPRRARRRA